MTLKYNKMINILHHFPNYKQRSRAPLKFNISLNVRLVWDYFLFKFCYSTVLFYNKMLPKMRERDGDMLGKSYEYDNSVINTLLQEPLSVLNQKV